MNIAIVVNRPLPDLLENVTGYVGYVVQLKRGLEEAGHSVDVVPIHNTTGEEFPGLTYIANDKKKIYEHVALNNTWVKNWWVDLLSNIKYDRIIVNFPVLIPDGLQQWVAELSKLIFILHDPSFIDPLYGRRGYSLLGRYDWALDRLYTEAHMYQIREHYRHQIQGVELDLCAHDFRNYAEACIRLFTSPDIKVISPSYALTEIVSQNKLTHIHTVPHPTEGVEVISGRQTYSVVTVASWDKLHLPLFVSVVQNCKDLEFILLACNSVELVLLNFYGRHRPKNLILKPFADAKEYDRILRQEPIGACFHPSLIMESFGYVPYEMARYGIPTLYLAGFTGLNDAKTAVGAVDTTPNVDRVSKTLNEMCADPREFHYEREFRQHVKMSDYLERIL